MKPKITKRSTVRKNRYTHYKATCGEHWARIAYNEEHHVFRSTENHKDCRDCRKLLDLLRIERTR